MTRDDIAAALERAAFLLELKGGNPFKIRAYTSAARAIETMPDDPVALFASPSPPHIPGIGPSLAAKLAALVTTGALPGLAELERAFPPGIFSLLELEGLGPKKIKTLHDRLGIGSVDDLERACADGRVAALEGFGERSAARLLDAIRRRRAHSALFLPAAVADEAAAILSALRDHPACGQLSAAGSFRRACETIHNLDLLASSKDPAALADAFLCLPVIKEPLARSHGHCAARLQSGIEARLTVTSSAEFPLALVRLTGAASHTARIETLAKQRGWLFERFSLRASPGAPQPPPIQEEDDLYTALGLEPVPPELREDRGEIEAAQHHALPRLIELSNLRGTFHVHTTASDGRGTLRDMAEAAMSLGLQYLGIADHSKSSFQANGLDERRLLAQLAEIRSFNRDNPGFRLFAGVECDILKDGSLDFPGDILARLDFVVVSIHSSFSLDRVRMTDRVIKAISSPHATILGHPTARLLGRREPCDLDIPAVIKAAAETGTVIELNCSPQRMDLDWRWWREAAEQGVLCSINPDAHSPAALGALWDGVRAARKGWLTRQSVINCLPLGKIEDTLAAKRRKAGLAAPAA